MPDLLAGDLCVSAAAGYDTQDAQDLTQSFFQHMLEDETLRRASRDKGRFRNFLLGALNICLADEQARRHALKRGGNFQMISVDALEAEELHHLRMAKELSPAELLDVRWAGVVLNRALEMSKWTSLRTERPPRLKPSRLSSTARRRIFPSMRGRTVGNLTRCGEDFDSPATTPIRHDVAARNHANGERTARSGRGVAGIANGVCSSRRTANLIFRVPANISHKRCETCGSSLDLEAPSGFCPACLFQTALNPEGEEAESAGARFTISSARGSRARRDGHCLPRAPTSPAARCRVEDDPARTREFQRRHCAIPR